ncbi:MAG: lipid A deacylase LpxR family protein [Hyphomonas sp.]|nr:lipid A deacylase LpxR family protein [Hyphomonas sp.]
MKARLSIPGAALVAAFLFAPPASGEDGAPDVPEKVRKPAVVSITTENDFFGGGTDRNYSNGLRIERVSAADDVHPLLNWVADRLPWIDVDRTDLRQGFGISHAIFTPEDIHTATPDPLDRPYAAWLALSSTIVATDEDTQDTLQVNLGIVGPSAAGEFVQNNWHKIIGIEGADGWDRQLKDEPGLEIIAQRLQMFDGPDLPLGLETDIGAHLGVALGNVRTYANMGVTARIGWDLNSSFAPPRIRPALSGAGEFIPGTEEDPWGGYAFIGIDGRAVARDMFLDGNLWRDSPRVTDRRDFTGDLQAGLAVHYRDVQLAFTFVHRTEQFAYQDGPQRFGALSISLAL